MLMIGITTSRSWRWPLWSAALWPLILSSNLPLNKWSQYDWLQTKTQSATLWWGFIILCFTTCAWDSHSVQSLTVYCDCWTCLVCHGPNKMEDMRKTPGTPGLENLWTISTDENEALGTIFHPKNSPCSDEALLKSEVIQQPTNHLVFFTSTVLPLYFHCTDINVEKPHTRWTSDEVCQEMCTQIGHLQWHMAHIHESTPSKHGHEWGNIWHTNCLRTKHLIYFTLDATKNSLVDSQKVSRYQPALRFCSFSPRSKELTSISMWWFNTSISTAAEDCTDLPSCSC